MIEKFWIIFTNLFEGLGLSLLVGCVNSKKRPKSTSAINPAINKKEDNSDLGSSLINHQCSQATFHSVSFSKPNPVWFGKVTPKNCVQFSKPIPVWFGKKKLILQDADSKPNSDWFGKFWWPLSMSWKFQTKFSLVWKNHWLLPTPWTLNQFQFYYVKSHFRKGKHSNMQVQD